MLASLTRHLLAALMAEHRLLLLATCPWRIVPVRVIYSRHRDSGVVEASVPVIDV